MRLSDPSQALRRELALGQEGAVITKVIRNSAAATADIRPGDVLLSVGGTEVKSAKHGERLLSRSDLAKGVRVRVKRGPYAHFGVLQRKP